MTITSLFTNHYFLAVSSVAILYSIIMWVGFRKSSRMLQSIPGFCMGVGILVTFYNMYDVFHGLNQQSINQLATQDLIREISSAFLGSLAGIFFGLIQTPFIKGRVDKIERTYEMSKPDPYNSLESIVENTLSNNQLLQNLINNVTQGAEMNERNWEAQRNIAQQMLNNINYSIEDLKDITRERLNNTNDSIKKMSIGAARFLIRFQAQSNQLNTELITNFIDSLNNKLAELSGEAMVNALKNIQVVQERFNNTLEQFQTQNNAMLEQLRASSAEQLTNHSQIIEGSMNQINETMRNMDENLSQRAEEIISARQEELSTVFNNTIDILRVRVENLSNIFTQLEESRQRTETLLSDVTNKFADAVENFNGNNDQVSDLLAEMRSQFNELVSLRDNAGNLVEACENIAGGVDGLRNRIQEINNVVTQLDGIKENLNLLVVRNN